MSEVILEGRALCKIYMNGSEKIRAVDGVDISLRKGSFSAISGPSGAGKSTLLHLIGGLDRPTSGRVFLGGVDLYKLSDSRRSRVRNERIGFVFQFYHLLPEFTALENVMMPALMDRSPRRAERQNPKEKAKAILKKVGLGSRMGHRPSELSGGEAQRVAIARALVNDPDILLCDEPTGNLDSEMGSEIIKLLIDVNRKDGVSIVIVTHEEALTKRSDEILRIKDGRLV